MPFPAVHANWKERKKSFPYFEIGTQCMATYDVP